MNRKTWLAVAVIGLAGLAAYIASPFLAFKQLRDAARAGDRERLEEMVDFPAVRDSLKSQLSAGAMRAMGPDGERGNNPLAALGALLAPALTDRLVDSVVTPDGIATLIELRHVGKPGQTGAAGPDGSGGGNGSSDRMAAVSYGFLSPDRFGVTMAKKDDPRQTLGLTLERRGLFSWKLVRIDLPDGLFGALGSGG